MRSRLLPVALIVCALTPTRIAAADDGASIKKNAVAPIAGTPFWPRVEVEAPARKPKSAALVILGAIIGSLGAAGAITGGVLLATSSGGCPNALDQNGNVIRRSETYDYWIDPVTRVRVNPTTDVERAKAQRITGQVDVTSCSGRDQREQIGLTTLLVSAGVAALGLTGVLVGIQPRADEEPSPSARFIPTLKLGPTGGTLTWQF